MSRSGCTYTLVNIMSSSECTYTLIVVVCDNIVCTYTAVDLDGPMPVYVHLNDTDWRIDWRHFGKYQGYLLETGP